MKEILFKLGQVIHNLQYERGCAAVYLYTDGRTFSHDLLSRQALTKQSVEDITHETAASQIKQCLTDDQLARLQKLVEKCHDLDILREKTVQKNISLPDLISYYTHLLITPFVQIMIEILLSDPNKNSTGTSAFHAFLNWKECTGLERAIGARGFVSGNFSNHEFQERMIFLLAEQENYKSTFFILANSHQKKLVERMLSAESSEPLAKIHELIQKNAEDPFLRTLDIKDWFQILSRKIEVLFKIEHMLIETLVEEDQKRLAKPLADAHIFPYMDLLKTLQLFNGISKEEIGKILEVSQIRKLNKGFLLFREGEPANRLYILLEGWLKLYKDTEQGEEAILEMLGAGSILLESSAFLNTRFPMSAQAIEPSCVLSIPAPLMREAVKENQKFAFNMITSVSRQSEDFLRQIKDTRLKTVDERITGFLLKLHLEQGCHKGVIELPYDKSLIASYLNMKRETFSRALKRLREKGFRIENDVVYLPGHDIFCSECILGELQECSKETACNLSVCDQGRRHTACGAILAHK